MHLPSEADLKAELERERTALMFEKKMLLK
jgi:hypothetical protein